MTEQELLSEIQANAGTYEDFTARTTAIFTAAKAYAAAQVAAKDADLKRKFGAPNNLDRPSKECSCSHTIDGRLVKQCDNCRNKPFVPADGVMAPAKPDIEIQPEDVMVVGNCANCGVEFHIHKQDSPADGDGVEERKDENGLLPCPFCGSKADFLTFKLQAFKGFEIRCSNQSCNAYKQTAPLNYWPVAQLDRQKAKWNTRAGRGIEG